LIALLFIPVSAFATTPDCDNTNLLVTHVGGLEKYSSVTRITVKFTNSSVAHDTMSATCVLTKYAIIQRGEVPAFVLCEENKLTVDRHETLVSITALELDHKQANTGEYILAGIATGSLLKVLQSSETDDFAARQAAIWINEFDRSYEDLVKWVWDFMWSKKTRKDRMIESSSLLRALELLSSCGYEITNRSVWDALECKIVALGSSNEKIRDAALSSLKTYGYECQTVLECLLIMVTSNNPDIRLTALESLGLVGNPKAITTLQEIFDQAEIQDMETLEIVATSLLKLNWRPTSAKQRCIMDLASNVRKSLVKMGPQAKIILQEIVDNASDAELKRRAKQSLEEME